MTLPKGDLCAGALPAPAAPGSMGSGVLSEEVVTAALRCALFPRKRHTVCWSVVNGEMWSKRCDNAYQWICEKSPKLSSASETRPLF